MRTPEILQDGDPRLARACRDFRHPTAAAIGPRYRTLVAAMEQAGLVGLASAQIGMKVRLFCARITQSVGAGRTFETACFANPRITRASTETCEMYEGCGSVEKSGLFVPVVRPRMIEMRALDERGAPFSLACDGVLARVVQHEMDHLDGVLMTARGDMSRALPRARFAEVRDALRAANPAWNITLLELRRPG